MKELFISAVISAVSLILCGVWICVSYGPDKEPKQDSVLLPANCSPWGDIDSCYIKAQDGNYRLLFENGDLIRIENEDKED